MNSHIPNFWQTVSNTEAMADCIASGSIAIWMPRLVHQEERDGRSRHISVMTLAGVEAPRQATGSTPGDGNLVLDRDIDKQVGETTI